MSDLKPLIECLEATNGPDRELDCLIENTLGIAKFERDPRVGFGDADYARIPPKPYTASLDAVMALMPEGHGWLVGNGRTRPDEPLGGAQIYSLDGKQLVAETEAATPDPNEIWEEYLADLEGGIASPQGALAFAVDFMHRHPAPASDGAIREALTEACWHIDGWDRARNSGRILLVWREFGGVREHVELGWYSNSKSSWVNTYGRPFSGDPNGWAPLIPFKSVNSTPAYVIAMREALETLRLWLFVEGCAEQVEIADDALVAAGITDVACPHCNGQGEWEEGPLPARSSAQIDPEYRQVKCPECEGSGRSALAVQSPATGKGE
ncbi:MAG: hypothetical protein J0G33_02870 [Afipia felis]|nr:hypothetical protein [Afipia felis]